MVDAPLVLYKDRGEVEKALLELERNLAKDPWGISPMTEGWEQLCRDKCQRQLERLEAKGTTSLRRKSAEACVEVNCLGPDDSELSWDELVKYVAEWYQRDYGEKKGKGGPERWVEFESGDVGDDDGYVYHGSLSVTSMGPGEVTQIMEDDPSPEPQDAIVWLNVSSDNGEASMYLCRPEVEALKKHLGSVLGAIRDGEVKG